MLQAKQFSTPLPANHRLAAPAVPAPSLELRPYPELVGSLIRWLSFLLAELGRSQPSVSLACDGASMIHLTENHVYHARNKHIEVRYFFVRKLVQSGFLSLHKVAANANLADIFTKALMRAPHRFYVRELGLTHVTTSGGVPVR
ncbi:unnamed protein product [Closterium sp. NIES-53]